MPKPKQRRRPKKSKSRPPQEPEWYAIKRILDQKLVNGRLTYLVDWEDNHNTGEAYPPSWEPEVTEDALADWEQTKAGIDQDQPAAAADPVQDSPLPVAPVAPIAPSVAIHHDDQGDFQESQAPRPSNWRFIQRANATALTRARSVDGEEEADEARPRKRSRPEYRKTPSEEPLPSVTSASSPASISVINSSYHAHPELGHVAVELFRNADFDPSGYHSVTYTQTTTHSSQSLAELEEEDRRVVTGLQPSPKTIPDSQETSGQTLSYPSIAPPSTHSAVIPDSQDLSHSAFGASPDSICRQDSSNRLRSDEPNQAQADLIADSQPLDSHIPSHQAEPNAETRETSTASTRTSAAVHSSLDRCDEPPQVTPIRPAPVRAFEPESSPRFLSQPATPFFETVLASYPPSQTLRLSDSLARVDQFTESVGSPRASQAAQVVTGRFGSTQVFSASHVSQSSSVHRELLAESQERNWRASYPELDKTLSQSASKSRSTSGQPSSQLDAMEKEGDRGTASSAGSRSIVDTLNQLIEETFADPGAVGSRAASIQKASISLTEETPGSQHGDVPMRVNNTTSQLLGDLGLDLPIPEVTVNRQSPSMDEIGGSRPSAISEFQAAIEASWGPDPSELPTVGAHDLQLATVSPAEITRHVDADIAPTPLLASMIDRGDLSPAHLFEVPAASITVGQAPGSESGESPSALEDPIPRDYVVTLPFQASMRPLYETTLLESRTDIIEFGTVFSNEIYTPPDERLVKRIDHLLGRLHNICDYPQDLVGTNLEKLPPVEQARYSCDANPKFCFISELLDGLENESEILIVASSLELLRLLFNITENLGVNCVAEALGRYSSTMASSAIRVTLALPDQEVNVSSYTVVVGFDHAFNGSPVARKLSTRTPTTKSPLVLMLVTTHSIEHIDLHITADIDPLTRRNALLSGIISLREQVSDPDMGYLEPDKLAVVFSDYLNGRVETIEWEPVPIPEQALDFFVSSQAQTQLPIGAPVDHDYSRKRKLDESDDEDAKRMRVIPLEKSTLDSTNPPLTDAVRGLLDNIEPSTSKSTAGQSTVNVSLATLEALAEKIAEYERQIAAADLEPEYKNVVNGLEKRVKEYERTNEKIYKSYRSALEDRTRFETQTRDAEKHLEAAQGLAQKESDKAKSKIADLEATVARLMAGSSGAAPQEIASGGPEAQLKELQDKIQVLEKRLENARQEADYARTMYQDASTAASSVGAENLELKEQNKDLQQKASDNLVKIHRIQADTSARQNQQRLRELRVQVREREIELDRARDELRQLKNGRRETRQASVPRSPRMGMMSPRTGRTIGGSASRGTSPVPLVGYDAAAAATAAGMQFMAQQTGNGRWNHLRE